MKAGDRPDTPPAVSKTLPTGRASVLEAPPIAPQTFSTVVPGNNSEECGNREQGKPMCCGPFYWTNAFLGWVVWIFSVSAVGDGAWIKDSAGEYGVDSRLFEEICSNSPTTFRITLTTACIAYEYFSVCQRSSTVSCSVAVLLYTISFFRPAEAPHGSAQALGLVGGIFMTIAAFFQMLACLFADETITEVNETIQLRDDDEVVTRGPTYGVGIIALLLGVINAIAVFVSYRHGADGPIFSRIKA